MNQRNPNWTRDELILALKCYIAHDGYPPGKTSPEIVKLSKALNRLGKRLGVATNAVYRNPNGVYMKLMNFRRFDEKYRSQGKVGLKSGGKTEEEVWHEFSNDPSRLAAAADTVLALVNSNESTSKISDFDTVNAEASEGLLVTRVHVARERSASITKKKKQNVFQAEGSLACEACGFDYFERYGERGLGFIECHHLQPVSELRPGQKTKLSDLALVCANCHRMIHAQRPWLTISGLRKLLK